MPTPAKDAGPAHAVAEEPTHKRNSRAWLRQLRRAAVLGVLVALFALAGWARFIKPVVVRAHRVDRGTIVLEVFGRGTVESRREAQLGFDLPGRLSDVLVDEGDRVKLGQEIAHLAPEQVQAELRTATSTAALARAALARLDADQKRADAALTFALTEEGNTRKLVTTGALPQRDLDLATEQLALAKAELARVEAQRTEAARGIDVARGGVDQQRAITSRLALIAPFDGIVLRRLRDPGDPVAVGATVLRVVATDDLWVRAWIDETVLGRLADDQPVAVSFPGQPAESYRGRVARIGREADRQTHELLVDVSVDRLPARVAVGQRADVWIQTAEKPDVVRLPLEWVRREPSGAPFVFMDRAGRVGRVAIELGAAGRDEVEVLAGLSAGDTVLGAVEVGAEPSLGRRWKEAPP